MQDINVSQSIEEKVNEPVEEKESQPGEDKNVTAIETSIDASEDVEMRQLEPVEQTTQGSPKGESQHVSQRREEEEEEVLTQEEPKEEEEEGPQSQQASYEMIPEQTTKERPTSPKPGRQSVETESEPIHTPAAAPSEVDGEQVSEAEEPVVATRRLFDDMSSTFSRLTHSLYRFYKAQKIFGSSSPASTNEAEAW